MSYPVSLIQNFIRAVDHKILDPHNMQFPMVEGGGPYIDIESGPVRAAKEHVDTAYATILQGWRRDDGTLIALDKSIDWGHELWAYDLHSWRPIGKLIATGTATNDTDLIGFAVGYVERWLEFATKAEAHPMLDHDMAIAMRTFKLEFLTRFVLQVDGASPRARDFLGLLEAHVHKLAEQPAFSAHNNHGVYQALALLAVARNFSSVPKWAIHSKTAESRLEEILSRQFSSDGIHLEHSPAYHYMLVNTLIAARSYDLLGPRVREQIALFEQNLCSMIMPDGTLVPFGDTNPRNLCRREERTDQFSNDELKNLLVLGQQYFPEPRLDVFAAGGFASFRRFGPAGHTYLAFQAAFHSRVHKHCDTMSFIWFDRSERLLWDAGAYRYGAKLPAGDSLRKQGFWYADPSRQLVESRKGHNVLEIDGQDEARTLNAFPGSVLGETAADDHIRLEGTYAKQDGSLHRRMIVLSPGAWLLVFDHVNFTETHPHKFMQRFIAAPNLSFEGDDVLTSASGTHLATATVASHATTRTRWIGEPSGEGWVSDSTGRLVPAPSFGISGEGAETVWVATVFELRSDVAGLRATRSSDGTFTIAWDAGGIAAMTTVRP